MSYELYEWQGRFTREGLTYGLRLEFVELLRPYVRIRSPSRYSERDELGEPADSEEPKQIKDIVDWEIVLGVSETHDTIQTLVKSAGWVEALQNLLPSLTSLLLEALDLMREMEGANDRSDGSYWHQPSIAEHPQNQKFRDWTILIELTRDAFLATAAVDHRAARAEIERWSACPYPIFRRLAFFAATETDLIESSASLQWLLADQGWWLWSVETERETLRLMAKLAGSIAEPDEQLLLSAILRGPPPEMFSADADAERLQRIANREVWLRLSKYQAAKGQELEGQAADTLATISKNFPDWQLQADESDEFPVWMGDTDDWYKKLTSPKELSALEDWLATSQDEITNDDWADRCKDDFSISIRALINLGKRGAWPVQRWRTALQVWSDKSLVLESWQQLRDILRLADAGTIEAISRPLSWWLESVGQVFIEGETTFFELIRSVLATQKEQPFDNDNDPIFKAINHPVGQVTDAVFRWWYRQGLEDGQRLKAEPKGIFSDLCNLEIEAFRYGRIILAGNLISLFRVDREWTERYVLPNLDWNLNSEEAKAAWIGFLRAPRLHAPLLASIRLQFLGTAKRYDDLGQFAQQYASLLTFVALEAPEPFTKKELALATLALPPVGLARCAQALVQGLEGAGEKRVEYWHNRIRPYLKDVWPKSASIVTVAISNAFTRLCMKSGDAFPDAVSELRPWLSYARQSDVTLHEFHSTGLTTRFPDQSLTFLDTILTQNSFYLPDELKKCLSEIRQARTDLESDPRFERLARFARLRGG